MELEQFTKTMQGVLSGFDSKGILPLHEASEVLTNAISEACIQKLEAEGWKSKLIPVAEARSIVEKLFAPVLLEAIRNAREQIKERCHR